MYLFINGVILITQVLAYHIVKRKNMLFQHNLKQRFVSLLRRFRVPDSEGGRGTSLTNPSDIQALFQELESLSCDEDSGAEQDTMSISSTPKPSLRPFFSSSRSLLENSALTSKHARATKPCKQSNRPFPL